MQAVPQGGSARGNYLGSVLQAVPQGGSVRSNYLGVCAAGRAAGCLCDRRNVAGYMRIAGSSHVAVHKNSGAQGLTVQALIGICSKLMRTL